MTTYPTWAAGQRVTAALLTGSGSTQCAIKSVNQTVTNSTVLVDCTDLVLPVVSGGIYKGRLVLIYTATAAQDLDFAWTVPSGSSGTRAIIGPDTSATAALPTAMESRATSSFATRIPVGGRDANFCAAIEDFLLTAGADGNVQLQFAQTAAAGATTAVVLANAHLVLDRIA